MENILKEIETKYPVDKVLVNGEQVWPYLRIFYAFAYDNKMVAVSEKDTEQANPKRIFPQRLKTLLKMLRHSCYGWGNWLGKYDYIVLCSTLQRRNINGEYFNRLFDPIIDELGRDRVLYIEYPAPALYPIRKLHTKNVVCHNLPQWLGGYLAKLLRKKYVIQNKYVLDSVQKEYGLEIDDVSTVASFNAQRRIFTLVFRMIKPKALLLSCYYGHNRPAVKAAKDLGIKVVEAQHGVIGKSHPAYNVHIELDRTYFPDYLLIFGRRELETFDNSWFIDKGNVYPVGSFYIEHVKKNYAPDPRLVEQLAAYKRSIGITLGWLLEKRTIEFVRRAADLDINICYVLIPHQPHKRDYTSLNLPDNVIVNMDNNFYELMKHVSFHATVDSTCALEAPSLGVQNILINIDNQSKRYYGKVLTDSRVTRYADTPEELVCIINSFEKLDRDTIMKLNEDIISIDYMHNIQTFIANHLGTQSYHQPQKK